MVWKRKAQIFFTLTVLASILLSACTPNLLSSGGNASPTAGVGNTAQPTQTASQDGLQETGKEGGAKDIIQGSRDIQGKVDQFRKLLGNDNGGDPGGKPSGRREVNWDGVPDELSAPNDYRGDFFNSTAAPRARGLLVITSGNKFMVSAASNNAAGIPARFGNINPTYPELFKAFSGERLFTPVNSNVIDVAFYVPGSGTPAAVLGFGAVFANVDGDGTFMEFLDQAGKSLGRFMVPSAKGDLSFLGVVFGKPVAARVRVKLGNSPVGPDDGSGINVVVMDDFIYGEPQPVSGSVAGVIEPPKGGSASRETETVTQTVTATATISPTAVAGVPKEFLMNFDDDGAHRLSKVTVDLTGLPPAPEGKIYVVWLMDYTGAPLNIGQAVAGQVFTYTDPAGQNLIGRYRGATLSLEDSQQAKTVKKPGEIRFSGVLPAPMLPLLQKLVVAAPDTPGNTPYGFGLQEQAAIADHHGKLLLDALNGGGLAEAKMHLEHIWNTLVGLHSPDYGDKNGDGRSDNPGDGFGIILYAQRMVSLLDQLAEMPGVNAHYQQGAGNAAQCVRSIANKLGPEVKNKALAAFAAKDTESALPDAQALVSAMGALANGFDINGNGTIDATEGECGAAQVYDLVRRLYHIHMAAVSTP